MKENMQGSLNYLLIGIICFTIPACERAVITGNLIFPENVGNGNGK